MPGISRFWKLDCVPRCHLIRAVDLEGRAAALSRRFTDLSIGTAAALFQHLEETPIRTDTERRKNKASRYLAPNSVPISRDEEGDF